MPVTRPSPPRAAPLPEAGARGTLAGALGGIGEGLVELTLGEREIAFAFGGDIANVCVMAARLGAPVRLAGRVGDDGFGARLRAFWEASGIDAGAVVRDPGAATGIYLNDRVAGGEHRFTYWRAGSAGSRLTAADLPERFFDGLGLLVVSGITLAISPTAAAAAAHAAELTRARGGQVACILNHRPALAPDSDAIAAFAAGSDVVIGSREDALAVLGSDRPAVVAERLGAHPRELVLTDGGRPATVIAHGDEATQAVPPATVRNAAGAGDALAGAYLAARLRGESPPASLAWGVAASSLSVQVDGCAASYPDADATAAVVARLAPAAPAPASPAPAPPAPAPAAPAR